MMELPLASRYIRNAAGEVVDEVEGPGVVGEFPVLKQGAPKP